MSQDDKPWEPKLIPAEVFHQSEGHVNINRAPHDKVSGVIYKRAMHIKRVQYEPLIPAPEMPDPWQGAGAAIVRWVFSEQPGTAENILKNRRLVFLHDTTLLPGSSTGMQSHTELDEVIYVLDGEGMLHHRPTDGSPVLARPLRPGDAALIYAGEYHSVANSDAGELRLIVLGLEPLCRA